LSLHADDVYLNGLALQKNGKIVVVGNSFYNTSYGVSIVRYNSNGTLDNTFSGDNERINIKRFSSN
jgi:hypothetical protein